MWNCPGCNTVNREADQACVVCGFERLKVGTRTAAPTPLAPLLPPTTGFAQVSANDPVAAVPPAPPYAPPPAPPTKRAWSPFLLLVIVIVVVLVGGTIMQLALSSEDEPAVETASVSETTVAPPVTDPPTTDTPTDPPTPFTPIEPTLPPTTILPSPADAYRGHVVAVLWSSLNATGSEIDQQRESWTQRTGSPVVVLDGNWYRSLRDDTVAVAYDGGFSTVRSAAQWCADNGLAGASGTSCFGVILSDEFSENDKGDGQGRFYPAGL